MQDLYLNTDCFRKFRLPLSFLAARRLTTTQGGSIRPYSWRYEGYCANGGKVRSIHHRANEKDKQTSRAGHEATSQTRLLAHRHGNRDAVQVYLFIRSGDAQMPRFGQTIGFHNLRRADADEAGTIQRRKRGAHPMSVKDKNRPLSLSPLTFDEAVTDILKIPPEPKCRIDSTEQKSGNAQSTDASSKSARSQLQEIHRGQVTSERSSAPFPVRSCATLNDGEFRPIKITPGLSIEFADGKAVYRPPENSITMPSCERLNGSRGGLTSTNLIGAVWTLSVGCERSRSRFQKPPPSVARLDRGTVEDSPTETRSTDLIPGRRSANRNSPNADHRDS